MTFDLLGVIKLGSTHEVHVGAVARRSPLSRFERESLLELCVTCATSKLPCTAGELESAIVGVLKSHGLIESATAKVSEVTR